MRERAKKKYRSLSEDEKDIRKQYQKDRYHNMSDEKKQRLKDYQKNHREAKKLKLILNQYEKKKSIYFLTHYHRLK